MGKIPKWIVIVCIAFMAMFAITAPVSAYNWQGSWSANNNQPSAMSCIQTAAHIGSAAGGAAIAGPGWIYAAYMGYQTWQSSYNCGRWIGSQFHW